LSQNEFTAEDLGEAKDSGLNYFLNVPKSKFRLGVNYFGDNGFRGNLSFQHDDAFFASLGQFSGTTNEKNLVDAGFGYKMKSGIALDLTCTNLFDSKYRAFVNMPNIGRRAILKLTIDIK
jgi:outer membrane receptor protein involved in Fe transport